MALARNKLPETIMVEDIVATQCREGSKGYRVGEENLRSCIHPHLKQKYENERNKQFGCPLPHLFG